MTKEQLYDKLKEKGVMSDHVINNIRPYQLEAIEFMNSSTRWLMCDDMG